MANIVEAFLYQTIALSLLLIAFIREVRLLKTSAYVLAVTVETALKAMLKEIHNVLAQVDRYSSQL